MDVPPSSARSSPSPLAKRTEALRSDRPASVPPSLTPPQLFLASSTVEMPLVHEELPSSPRRARADTLPSTFHLPNSATPLARGRSGTGLTPPAATPLNASTTSLPEPEGSIHPNFFPASVSSPSLIPQLAQRLRSGSLTLPSANLSNAFGPPVWSGGWTTAPTPQSAPGFRASGRPDITSPDGSIYGEDSHVRTLDYLGLDGDLADDEGAAGRRRSETMMHSSSSFGNLRTISDLNSSVRLRSNTVATFPRTSPYAPSRVSEGDEEFLAGENSSTFSHRSNESVDSSRLLYSTAVAEDDVLGDPSTFRGGVHDSPHARARAATIGILDDSREVYLRRRAGTTTGMTPHAVAMGQPSPGLAIPETPQEYSGPSEYPGGAASVMARGMRGLTLNPEETQAWSTSRPITPVEGVASIIAGSHQQPTRSLWIGNLDPKTTPAELQAVFAPYGAIESLRLIPEKECGFVNFVSVSDAIHAKEDVLNRLGGQLTKQSGMVRIGFGKSEGVMGTPSRDSYQSRGANGGPFSGSPEGALQNAPTRALWIGSIPASTTPNNLLDVFSAFGPIESARVLPHKSCGFVNFEHTDDAVAARKALNGREILGVEAGSVRVGFAKVPVKVSQNSADADTIVLNSGNGISNGPAMHGIPHSPSGIPYYPLLHVAGASVIPPRQQLAEGAVQDYRSNLLVDLATNGSYASSQALQAGLSGSGKSVGDVVDRSTIVGTVNEMQLLMRELGEEGQETEEHVKAVTEPREPATYYTSIASSPAFSDPTRSRHYANADAPRLRELRKKLESSLSPSEADAMAFELVDECVPLSSDYIGNTIIQKIFERATFDGRKVLLEKIAPHLAVIGTHKNGTWAVQKIIQCVQEPEEFILVTENLAPYCPPLLLNDFGNYVVQGALRFGTPLSDFIFDAMVDRCWEIGSGRFGARSTRQTLESPLASRFNIKRVAISIVLNSIPLATNSNGALLVTWLLDSSSLPGRYRVLASRFAPHLPTLCTHKLASLAVFKIINQRNDPVASRTILDVLFNDQDTKTLEDILTDQTNGVACISKILNSAALEQKERTLIVELVRPILARMGVQATAAYRRIVEEVGLIWMGQPGPSPSLESSPLPSQQHQQQQQQQHHSQHQAPFHRPSNHASGSLPPPWMPSGPNGYLPYGAEYQNLPQFPYGQSYPPQFPGGGAPYPYYVPYSPGFDPSGNYPGSQQPSPMMIPQSLPPTMPPSFNPLVPPQNGTTTVASFLGAPQNQPYLAQPKGRNSSRDGKGPGY